MFPFPIAKPQKCDIQTFYGSNASGGTNRNARSWSKPVGVSHVYMMLIGGGAYGDGITGGGSGSVTVWYGAAQHVPNWLLIFPSTAASDSYVAFNSSSNILLIAQGANSSTGAPATAAGPFAASGFYKSTAGQDGVSGSVTASATTFLSGGGATGNNVTANYGYRVTDAAATGKPGFLLGVLVVEQAKMALAAPAWF